MTEASGSTSTAGSQSGHEQSRALEPLSADPVVHGLLLRGIEQAESGHPQTQSDQLATLVREYYRHVDPIDLVHSDATDLIGMVTSHRRMGAVRKPGEINVEVFTPTVQANGWSSGHSVVQVVTDDMPFVVDSVMIALREQQQELHLVIHPQLVVCRDEQGKLLEVRGLLSDFMTSELPEGAQVESWVAALINRETAADALTDIRDSIEKALGDVEAAVTDWEQMRDEALALATELQSEPPKGVDPDETAEAVAFLQWAADNNFTFLGYREYTLNEVKDALSPVPGSALGVMRSSAEASSTSFAKLPPSLQQKAVEPHILVLTKANTKSTVHRGTYLDYIGVKKFAADGQVVGERRFIGLYTGTAYAQPVSQIPVLRQLEEYVLSRAVVDASSHRGKDLMHFIETYPRDDLFQVTPEYLFATAMSVLGMQERRLVRVFVRKDTYGRFYSVLVYLPRDRYTTAVRLAIQNILMDSLQGQAVEYAARVSESLLARLAFTIRIDPSQHDQHIDLEQVRTRIVAAVRNWDDDFYEALVAESGEESAAGLRDYAAGFPDSYREIFSPRAAVADVRIWESLPDADGLAVNLYEPLDAVEGERRFKLFRTGRSVSLLEVLPILGALDVEVLDERPYDVARPGRTTAYMYDFGLQIRDEDNLPELETLPQRFSEAFQAAFSGQLDPDPVIGLVTRAGLTWHEAAYVQAWVNYARQLGSPFSYRSFAGALLGHPHIVHKLIELFRVRHDPDFDGDRDQLSEQLSAELYAALDDVISLDNDRILRQLIGIVRAILRTNAFQLDAQGQAKRWLSFKLDSASIPGMPLPSPKFEIFVFSSSTSGVHLRFGSVARGGLRWSDRRDDFRTEVLGLVKAQEVKNAVIVPVGSKGGFVVKHPLEHASREELQQQGRACYTEFISGLLDLTDNRVGGAIVPPERTVRWDNDDPYLVVAADKGTATFSDLANSISANYDFWLGDAFASGGSAGYDHKEMGITARGAWESVKRHFRELGIDVQTESVTVAGIGDMSGDVFGNGMLLSTQLKVVAAFDHRHIFLDPNPSPEASFAERQRLYDLPRSSWADYDPKLISVGGGVYPRSAKSIPITPEVRERLGLEADVTKLAPSDLLRAILQAPVDLLWNGGIGTYVKSSAESDLDVGDKSNDAIRINGRDVRARVIGEGGNLGLTQRGRIEAARSGVLLNTDAVDNSAGVDCSDHEVNIKIALNQVVANGDLTTKQRNILLAEMTDEVSRLVLRDNYEQNVLLGNARVQSVVLLPVHQRLMRHLESIGELNRALEFLPSDEECEALQSEGKGLSSPELCTLMAYSKIWVTSALDDSDIAEEQFYQDAMLHYFPAQMIDRYSEQLAEHPLRSEIVATMIANAMINRGGITFAFRAMEETGASIAEIARAYSVSRAVFDLDSYWQRVEDLDNQIPTIAQARLNLEIRRLLDRATRWFLTARGGRIDVAGEIDKFATTVQSLASQIPDLLVGMERGLLQRRIDYFTDLGAPADLAADVASLLDVFSLLDIAQIAARSSQPAETVAQVYFNLSERFGIDNLLFAITALPRDDRWDALARSSLRSDVYGALAGLTAKVLRSTDASADISERIDDWSKQNAEGQARAHATLTEIMESGRMTLSTISVALRVIRTLVYQGGE